MVSHTDQMNRTQFLQRPCVDSFLSSAIPAVCTHYGPDWPERQARIFCSQSFLPFPPCVMETSTFVIASAQRIWPISKPPRLKYLRRLMARTRFFARWRLREILSYSTRLIGSLGSTFPRFRSASRISLSIFMMPSGGGNRASKDVDEKSKPGTP